MTSNFPSHNKTWLKLKKKIMLILMSPFCVLKMKKLPNYCKNDRGFIDIVPFYHFKRLDL